MNTEKSHIQELNQSYRRIFGINPVNVGEYSRMYPVFSSKGGNDFQIVWETFPHIHHIHSEEVNRER